MYSKKRKTKKFCRIIQSHCSNYSQKAGKTTLVKSTFPDKLNISLENPKVKNFAIEDTEAFTEHHYWNNKTKCHPKLAI
jgi:hypothetical protein